MMNKFVESCAEDGGSNSIIKFANRYTADRSNWKDQFIEERNNMPPPSSFNRPSHMPPHTMEKQMIHGYFDPRDFENFERHDRPHEMHPPHHHHPDQPFTEPGALPPQLFHDFVHSLTLDEMSHRDGPLIQGPMNLAPDEKEKIKYRSHTMARHFRPGGVENQQVDSFLSSLQIDSGESISSQSHQQHWSPGAIESRHKDWINEMMKQEARREEFGEFEGAWARNTSPGVHHRPDVKSSSWTNEFYEQDHEFEDIYAEKNPESKEWSESFIKEEEEYNNKNFSADATWQDLARQASTINDPKLQNSQFIQFINKMATGDIKIENGSVVETTPVEKMANEFLAGERNRQSWVSEFDEEEEFKEWDDSWKNKFSRSWANEFTDTNFDNDEDLVDHYSNVWENLRKEESNGYNFQEQNEFLSDPEAYNKGLELFNAGDIPKAILAFEAAVAQNDKDANAWCKLGLAQAENDKDNLAIKALEQSIAVQPDNLEALLGLAVSHTNEFHVGKAVETLRSWLSVNPTYASLAGEAMEGFIIGNPDANLKRLEGLFIQAARLKSSTSEIDPDIHTALGLLYNLSFEYDRAIDCFRAALTKRPNDYLLWNKLGATTANSNHGRERAPEAIDAYCRALEQKPTYTRARSNLGISFMAMHNYPEAAKCFLGALDINNSEHLWDNLRSAFSLMQRYDLVEKINAKNPQLFKPEFDF
eukprot:TRINITY_DN2225_c0_g1_i2.p1 TRINITY_DN2225_c0_g1~~TRINITY_DN2225_c0_g1_i2.p1  ORF type:complete len:704 (-),score=174.46 TRINITY_DN2225_c0_g1_i2:125-2236(-)